MDRNASFSLALFTTEELAEISLDLAHIDAEEAREDAELEWFEMMDSGDDIWQ